MKRIFIIIIGCLSIGYSQSFFNRIVGSDPYLASGRSLAMGGTSLSEKSTHLLFLNPAGLWRLGDGFSLEYHLGGISSLERRGFDLKDFFGDYLTTSDYVVNYSNMSFSGLGISGSKSKGLFTFTSAFSVNPLTSFAYKYVEEIRGKMSFDDGIIGNKDPLLGFHQYEVQGQLDRYSIGLGLRYKLDEKITLNWGFAYHNIPESSIHDIFRVDTLQTMDGYLATINSLDNVVKTKEANFISFGFELNTWKGIYVSIGFDTELEIKSEAFTPPGMDTDSGLPGFISGDTLSFQLEGVHYVKPFRTSFGIAFTTHGSTPLLITSDYSISDGYSMKLADSINYLMKKSATLRLGLEYMTLSNIPVRVGLIYKQSPFQVLDPNTIITVGSGKSFGKVLVDFALGFQSMQYKYPDLFPVEDDVRPDLDTVKESSFNFMVSLKYSL